MSCILQFDGACRGNPGLMAIGVVLTDDGGNIREVSKRLNKGTNNIAEWKALIEGLKLARDLGCKELEVRGDSQLIIKQVTGKYRVKSSNLIPLFNEAKKLCGNFDKIKFKWVKREDNSHTDALCNRALDMK